MRRKKAKTVMMRVSIPTRDFIKNFAKEQGKSIPDAMKILARRMRK